MARPKEAILSRNLIRDQALSIIDEEGLDALTMRRLATRLGVQAASLYTHFDNKDAVLDAIAGRLARRIDPSGFEAGWQEGLRTWASSYYAAIHWHPNAAPVVAAGASERSEHRAMLEHVHSGLVAQGWPVEQATRVAAAVRFVVLGATKAVSADRGQDDPPSPSRAAAVGRPADGDDAATFVLALDSLLRGLEPVYDAVRTGAKRPRAARPVRGGRPRTLPRSDSSASRKNEGLT